VVAEDVRWLNPGTTGTPHATARDVARDLAELAATLASLKAEVTAWFSDPSYDVLRFRLEEAHSVVEAATIEGPR
jgi:hypothetical protein